MKTIKLIALFLFVTIGIRAQNIIKDTVPAKNYFGIGEEYFKNKKYDTAAIYFEKASDIYLQTCRNNKIWQTYGYKYLLSETKHGVCFQKQRKFDKASSILKKAIKKTLSHINENDTIVADAYHSLGFTFYYKLNFDSVLFYWEKELKIKKELFGENHISVAGSYNNIGIIYFKKNDYELSLKYYLKALKLKKELLGEKHISIAKSYNNIGKVFEKKSEYDLAIKYYLRAIKIRKELLGENHNSIANSYNDIGNAYTNKSEYDLALEFYLKSLIIRKNLLGDEHVNLAMSYNNIGAVYVSKKEYNLAIEYYLKSLNIYKKILGENNKNVALSYNNIGVVYTNKKEYDLALKYYIKSLSIREDIFGKNNISVAVSYNNIGSVYYDKKEYDLALDYYLKSLEISTELYGQKHIAVAAVCVNIGNIYKYKDEYDLSLDYYLKSLTIYKDLLSTKHTNVALSYNTIAKLYKNNNKFDSAIKYFQKAVASSLRKFNDTANVNSVPLIKDYLDRNQLLSALQGKAEIFAGNSHLRNLGLSLRHYQACDTLISQVRQNIKTKSDKIALGERASEVYKEAVGVCMMLPSNYKEQAFYFSEKNKSSVLLESLAGTEAQKFAGIPDTLLKQEHKLQIDIALYEKILAEGSDSLKEARFKDKLFKVNRSYDSLIVVFENNYPKYYDLKYNQKPVNVKQIQKMLDNKTALISYFTGDSTITIFIITKKKFDVLLVEKTNGFEDKISEMRENVSNTNFLAGDQINNTHNTVDIYQKNAFELYNLLFPKKITNILGKKTKSLVIIPDGTLATIPFEALLTQKYTSTWTDWKNNEYFSEMPYLIKDYNISYTYSTNLFYKTFNTSDKQRELEITDLYDWLAFAPVFDNKNISGTAIHTRKLLNEITETSSDTIKTRAFTRDGMYISELPGSLSETKSIVKLFAEKDKNALLKTHLQANETFVKSGELSKYKYLHFATHGIVNEEKPELSGLILAQDTTSSEDNILFTGEIYNIKLNADLTVMSACETGLGKIAKGEGVIGLTRALLYAGSKSIVVSLWQVSDASTNKLMVDFYKNFLNDKKTKKYGKHLRNAKLKMIEEGKYAHPFFWSPFILIGE